MQDGRYRLFQKFPNASLSLFWVPTNKQTANLSCWNQFFFVWILLQHELSPVTIQSRLDMEIGQFMGSLCSTAVGTRWCPLSSYQSCFVSRFTIWFTVDISTVYFIGIFSTNRNTPGTPPCIGNIQLLILVGQLDPSQYQHQYPTKPYLLNCQVKLINLPLKGGFSQTYNCFYTFTTKPF